MLEITFLFHNAGMTIQTNRWISPLLKKKKKKKKFKRSFVRQSGSRNAIDNVSSEKNTLTPKKQREISLKS